MIDETDKVATLESDPVAPYYTFWGGNAEVLTNGDIEFCESANPAGGGDVYEIMPGSDASTVWQLHVSGQNPYRGERLPSLYPGVQW